MSKRGLELIVEHSEVSVDRHEHSKVAHGDQWSSDQIESESQGGLFRRVQPADGDSRPVIMTTGSNDRRWGTTCYGLSPVDLYGHNNPRSKQRPPRRLLWSPQEERFGEAVANLLRRS